MNKFIGTKEVKARPLNLGAYNALRGWDMPKDENPDTEGYLVEYLDSPNKNHPDYDNYISWSPKGVFERSYKLSDTFLDRLILERDELQDKTNKLTSFLSDKEKAIKISGEAQYELLVAQLGFMQKYLEILNLRITHLSSGTLPQKTTPSTESTSPGPFGLLHLGRGTFGQATEAAKQGKRVARMGWNGSGMFAYIVPAASYPARTEIAKKHFGDMVPYRAYWALKTAQNDIATWAPSGSDSLAEDWMILD